MIFNAIDAMLRHAMHLFLLDLCNEMMQCCLNKWDELMQNAKCIAFFSFFSFSFFLSFLSSHFQLGSFVNFSNLYWRSSNITHFLFLHCEANGLSSKSKTSFSRSDQHYFLFFSPSLKHWSLFRYKTFYFISDLWSFNGSIWLIFFSRIFHSFPNHPTLLGFMMHHFQNFDPFCLLKIPISNINLLFYRPTLIMQIK